MRRLFGVLLIVVAMIWVRQIGSVEVVSGAEPSGVALALGFSLVVALVTGELFRRLRLPRLTGYLLFGVLVGPYLGNLVNETMARQLQVINGIATTLIAFIAGLTLNLERIGPRVDWHRAADHHHARRRHAGAGRRGVGDVVLAARGARRRGPGQALDGRAPGHRHRQLLADDGRRRDLGDRIARTAERPRAGHRGVCRSHRAGAVLDRAAGRTIRVRSGRRRRGQRPHSSRLGDRWRGGLREPRRCAVRAVPPLRRARSHRRVDRRLRGPESGGSDRTRRAPARGARRRDGDRERGGGAGRCAQDRAAAGRAARARRLLRGGGHLAPARCPHAARSRGCAPGPRARRAHPPRCRRGPAHGGHR